MEMCSECVRRRSIITVDNFEAVVGLITEAGTQPNGSPSMMLWTVFSPKRVGKQTRLR